MKIPRDINGRELARALRKLGYEITRQTGSHIRVTTQRDGEHHEVVPDHQPVKIGTLSGILRSISSHHRMTVAELLDLLDL